jgi:hypothetical protein
MIKTLFNAVSESLPVAGGAAGSVISTAEIATQITQNDSGLVSILTYLGFTILGAMIGWLVRVALNCAEQYIRRSINRKREAETRPKKK